MTASISIPARAAGRISAERFAGFGPLFRKDLREWAHSTRVWVHPRGHDPVHDPDRGQRRDQHLGHRQHPGRDGVGWRDLARSRRTTSSPAITTQFFVLAAIFASMGLLVAERDRGTLAWVASKPVSRGAIWLSKWVAAGVVVSIAAGIVPMAATFGLVVVLYGSAGSGRSCSRPSGSGRRSRS